MYYTYSIVIIWHVSQKADQHPRTKTVVNPVVSQGPVTLLLLPTPREKETLKEVVNVLHLKQSEFLLMINWDCT
jgi:hypothetical protein